MKKCLLSLFAAVGFIGAFAQTKVVDKAVLQFTINIVAEEDEDDNIALAGADRGPGGGGMMRMSNMMDGETKITSFITPENTKMVVKSESINASIFKNETTKETATIFSMMGTTMGIKSSPEDEAEMKKRMDSMRAERAKTDSNARRGDREGRLPKTITVNYIDESKKISGYACKKALIITDRVLRKDTQVVWYCPDFKIKNFSADLGNGVPMMRGFGNTGSDGFDKIDGTVMLFEKKMPRNRTMEFKVTKVELDKDTPAKEFEIPKDVELKTMKEMQQGGGMRMIMR
jgi:hypothetical protein